jgi:hypothetical protein
MRTTTGGSMMPTSRIEAAIWPYFDRLARHLRDGAERFDLAERNAQAGPLEGQLDRALAFAGHCAAILTF